MTGRDYEIVVGAGGFLTSRVSTQPPTPDSKSGAGRATSHDPSQGPAAAPAIGRFDTVIEPGTRCHVCNADPNHFRLFGIK